MAHAVPYLLGGLTAFLVADILPLPSPSEHLGGLFRAGFTTPASAQSMRVGLHGTPASSVNRAAKGDRGDVSFVVKAPHLATSAVKPAPANARKEEARDQEQARDRKPETSQDRRPPVGCDPMFSPVASPSLAHHFGRCMS